MFTKFVVSVARARRTAPRPPIPAAASITPGFVEPAARAATKPRGRNQRLVRASPRKTGAGEPRPERRERRDERGPENGSSRDEEGRLLQAEGGREARARLERRRDEVRPRDDEEEVDGGLRLLGVGDRPEIGGLHQAAGIAGTSRT